MTKINGNVTLLSLVTILASTHFVYGAAYFLPEYPDKGFNLYSGGDLGRPMFSVRKECLEQGYTQESCPNGSYLDDKCPLGVDIKLYKNCISNAASCLSGGYVLSCPLGEEPDLTKYCNHDNLYIKCQCATCLGFDYTQAEATSLGYVQDGEPCKSCETLKYKRKPAACEGFNFDSTNCGISDCATLEGLTCISGNVTKYSECKACPPPVPTCSYPQVKVEDYWCGGGLRCWIPTLADK